MEASSVVDLVDEARKVLRNIGEGFISHRIDGFDLEGLQETLGFGVDAPMSVKSWLRPHQLGLVCGRDTQRSLERRNV
jgi:hypothetical protein